jgi:DNA-binding transcriptional MerR regulator
MENFKNGSTPIYTINQASQMTLLSKPTVRYYEDIGLISNIFRDKNNIRLYTDNNIRRLRIIQCMRSSGMGIGLIRHYFDLSNEDVIDLKERYSIILQQEQILMAKKEELEKQLTFIQRSKLECEEELRYREQTP